MDIALWVGLGELWLDGDKSYGRCGFSTWIIFSVAVKGFTDSES